MRSSQSLFAALMLVSSFACYPASGDTADGADTVPQSNYPHINSLETEILGQTYPQDPLVDRISRMEIKAFGAASTDPDLSNRTDLLDSYAEKKLHKKSFDKQQAEQAQSEGCVPATGASGSSGGTASGAGPGYSKSKALLNFVGSQLLGMTVPGLGQFAGVRARPRSEVQQEQQAVQKPTKQEDPAVLAPTPPPAGSHVLTKVAWCELRVFGQTSPQLHLVERLEKLNALLKYAPAQTGIDLMDDVPKLIQSAAAHSRTEGTADVKPAELPVAPSSF